MQRTQKSDLIHEIETSIFEDYVLVKALNLAKAKIDDIGKILDMNVPYKNKDISEEFEAFQEFINDEITSLSNDIEARQEQLDDLIYGSIEEQNSTY